MSTRSASGKNSYQRTLPRRSPKLFRTKTIDPDHARLRGPRQMGYEAAGPAAEVQDAGHRTSAQVARDHLHPQPCRLRQQHPAPPVGPVLAPVVVDPGRMGHGTIHLQRLAPRRGSQPKDVVPSLSQQEIIARAGTGLGGGGEDRARTSRAPVFPFRALPRGEPGGADPRAIIRSVEAVRDFDERPAVGPSESA